MPCLFQPWPDIGMIKYFAVLDDPQRACFVSHRLMARRKINDAESPVPKMRAFVVVMA